MSEESRCEVCSAQVPRRAREFCQCVQSARAIAGLTRPNRSDRQEFSCDVSLPNGRPGDWADARDVALISECEGVNTVAKA